MAVTKPDNCPECGSEAIGANPSRWSPSSNMVANRERTNYFGCEEFGCSWMSPLFEEYHDGQRIFQI